MLRRFVPLLTLILASASVFAGCPDPETGGGPRAGGPKSEKAIQWMKRANEEFAALDLNEAHDSVVQAQAAAPGDAEIAILAARIELARLEFKFAEKALEGIEGSEAQGLRARAFWYGNELQKASDELSAALADPAFKDPWAKPVRELAGTQGTGRKPFTLKDNSARLVELRMPRDLGVVLMIQCEIDGQASVCVLDTGVPEVILDSKARSSPGWVSFKFTSPNGERSMEFRDVPAFVQDLSQFTKGQTVPVSAVLGMNFIRRLNITFDRLADQLIIRRDAPPEPTIFSKVPVAYYNGGGMLVRSSVRKSFEVSAALWINSGTDFPLALNDATFKKIGIDTGTLPTVSGKAVGRVDGIRLGPLDLGPSDAMANQPNLEETLAKFKGFDVMGQVGMGFLAGMRVTVANGGKELWVETDQNTPAILAPGSGAGPVMPKPPPPKPAPTSAPTTAPTTPPKPAPTPTTPPKPAATAAPKPAPAAAPKPAPTAAPKPPPPAAPAGSAKK